MILEVVKSVVYCLVLLGSVIVMEGCSSGRLWSVTKSGQPPLTLGQGSHDVEGNRRMVLSLIWVEGRHTLEDKEEWCGQGEKYSGKFIFRVELWDKTNGSARVDTPLEAVCPEGCFDFIFADKAQPWEIHMADYNNDGQPDFNIVTYGGCSHSACWLFTVTPSGRVELLKVDGKDDFLVLDKVSYDDNSVAHFDLTPAGFWYERFDFGMNTQCLEFLDWDPSQKTFRLREQKIVLRP